MAQFAFMGDEAGIAVYGLRFPHGVTVDVHEPYVIAKLRHMRYPDGRHYFAETFDGVQVLEAAEPVEPVKRRGRPPKAR